MDITIEIDLGQAARELGLPLESVQNTVHLLDEGNTVPFITRFRKEQTGALDEDQVRRVQECMGKLRALAERKQTILKSIQAQGLMTPELGDQIRTATTAKRLEDLYLPYKPKKQTLATTARQRGLEPLANEVLQADPAAADLAARAAAFVAPEKDLPSIDEVLTGVRHIIAESFGERADVRGKLRKVLQKTAKLICSRIDPARRDAADAAAAAAAEAANLPELDAADDLHPTDHDESADPLDTAVDALPDEHDELDAHDAHDDFDAHDELEEHAEHAEHAEHEEHEQELVSGDASLSAEADGGTPAETRASDVGVAELSAAVGPESVGESTPESTPESTLDAASEPVLEPLPESTPTGDSSPASDSPGASDSPAAPVLPAIVMVTRKVLAKKQAAQSAAAAKKEKKRQRMEAAFKDYFSFQESISRIPPHRILAINRGERARILRVKMESDTKVMGEEAERHLIPEGHPHAEFLRGCVRDALQRLIVPGLERELRRELAEAAEEHAVEVFARNLRKLLLQPPVRNHRVLAVDPGFRSGCKLIALDEFGNVLGHEIIHVIGREDWIRAGRGKIVDLIRRHHLTVIAIGNGAGCRETEQLVVDVMENELKEDEVAFVIVNEAGASVYSTSPVGREELPGYDAVLRSAISIGRRLLDPLSELVKINPANIGVGMYQHDVKAKHLRNSLDAVVESCVNYVGVDVNTASPALLRYVSGMNQLTARRLCEYRAKHGPFRSRDQLKQVSGLGEATFVQAAGFLKIAGADNPLDATWIHPESYELAQRVLERAGCSLEELAESLPPAAQLRPVTPAAASWVLPEESPADLATRPIEAATVEPVPVDTPTDVDVTVAPLPIPDAEVAPETVIADAQATAEVLPAELADDQRTVDTTEAPLPAVAVSEEAVSNEAPVVVEEAPSEAPPAVAVREGEKFRRIQERVSQLETSTLAHELDVSEVRLRDILASLARPGRDPREDLPAPVFRRGVVKLEDLQPGMMLSGTVLNVVDFGAFVDIGLPDSGLVHISRLADRFVRDPHEVVGVGDIMTVWVVDVDKQRRRVSLTAIEPGTEKPAESRREPVRQQRPPRSSGPRPGGRREREGQGQGQGQGAPPRSQGRGPGNQGRNQQRPPRPAPKPKIVKPITKEMEEGKEPLRSFSDLMQFYQKKKPDEK